MKLELNGGDFDGACPLPPPNARADVAIPRTHEVLAEHVGPMLLTEDGTIVQVPRMNQAAGILTMHRAPTQWNAVRSAFGWLWQRAGEAAQRLSGHGFISCPHYTTGTGALAASLLYVAWNRRERNKGAFAGLPSPSVERV
jgi:hypothetical protein